MTKTAIRIEPNGKLSELDLDAPEGSLKVLQGGVGGLIEPVDLAESFTMWVNEEFLYGGEDPNILASMALHMAERASVRGQAILGSVVFTGGQDEDGNSLGLTDEDAADLHLLAEEMYPEQNLDPAKVTRAQTDTSVYAMALARQIIQYGPESVGI